MTARAILGPTGVLALSWFDEVGKFPQHETESSLEFIDIRTPTAVGKCKERA